MTGASVPNATVEIFPGPRSGAYYEWYDDHLVPSLDPLTPTTRVDADASGCATIEELAAGRWFVVVSADGFARTVARATRESDHGCAELDVDLVDACSLEVSVAGLDGEPAVGVPVIVAPTKDSCAWPDQATFTRATTDTGGRCSLDALAPGTYVVWYVPVGGVPMKAAEELAVPAVGRFDIRLHPGAAVSGTVHDFDTGRPLPGALVRLYSGEVFEGLLAEARCDAAGQFTALTHRDACALVGVVVIADGYAPLPVADPGHLPYEIVVDGQRISLDVQVSRGAAIDGRVAGPEGPIAGAHVSVECRAERGHPLDDSEATRYRSAYTDSDGRYRLAWLPPGKADVLVAAGGRRWERDEVDVPVTGAAHRDFTLDALPSFDVHGRVLDKSGGPLADALVVVGEGASRAETRSGPDGSFSVVASTDPIRVEISHEGLLTWTGGVVGDPKEWRRPWEVTLLPAQSIRGRVLSPDGAPMPHTRVRLMCGDQTFEQFIRSWSGIRDAVTGTDGRYEFAWTYGAHSVTAWSSDGRSCAVDVSDRGADGPDVHADIEFERTMSVSGRAVLAGTDRPLRGLTVVVGTDAWGWTLSAVTDEDGGFRVDCKVPSEHPVITVSGDGFWDTKVKSGDLQAGDVRVEMRPMLRLDGRVRRFGGGRVVGAVVWIEDEDWGRMKSKTDADGRFVFPRVRSVDYEVRASVDDAPAVDVLLTVRGGTHDCEVTLPDGK